MSTNTQYSTIAHTKHKPESVNGYCLVLSIQFYCVVFQNFHFSANANKYTIFSNGGHTAQSTKYKLVVSCVKFSVPIYIFQNFHFSANANKYTIFNNCGHIAQTTKSELVLSCVKYSVPLWLIFQDFHFSANANKYTIFSNGGHTAHTTRSALVVSSVPMIPGFLYQVSKSLSALIFLTYRNRHNYVVVSD